jgi:ribosomal protein S18 acetylase RimI-like enzyme
MDIKIQYRLLNSNDAAAYRKIRLAALLAYPESYCANYQTEKEKPLLFFEKNLIENNPMNFVFGAFAADQLIGICACALQEDEQSSHTAELLQMYVQKDFQQNGIGLELCKKIVAYAHENKKATTFVLEVLGNHPHVVKCYSKAGFVEVATQQTAVGQIIKMILHI